MANAKPRQPRNPFTLIRPHLLPADDKLIEEWLNANLGDAEYAAGPVFAASRCRRLDLGTLSVEDTHELHRAQHYMYAMMGSPFMGTYLATVEPPIPLEHRRNRWLLQTFTHRWLDHLEQAWWDNPLMLKEYPYA